MGNSIHNSNLSGSVFQFFKFGMAGVFNTLLGYAIIFLFYWFGVEKYIASFMGYVFGIALSFFLSKGLVFKSGPTNSRQILKYLVSFAIAFVVNAMIIGFVIGLGYKFLIAQIFGSMGYLITFFLLSKFWVFKTQKDM